jgi:hypothetical protein
MLLPSRHLCLVLALVAVAGCDRAKAEKAEKDRSAATSAVTTGTPVGSAGKFTIVSLKPAQGELGPLLAAEAKKARAEGRKPFAEIGAGWCSPCKKLEASLSDPRMVDAGLKTGAIPVFFELGDDGRPTGRKIDGGAWEEDIPANMAPPLKKFFHTS